MSITSTGEFPAASRGASGGFILVVTLWMLLAMTLSVGFIADWVDKALIDSDYAKRSRDYQILEQSSRASLLYLLTTRRMTVGGVSTHSQPETAFTFDDELSIAASGNEFRVDGSTYELSPTLRFSLQDQRGLVNVNYGSQQLIDRFLVLMSVGFEQRQKLLASLSDYIDEDDLFRLNGAERSAYTDAGLIGPANRYLQSPLELRRVLGWGADQLAVADRVLADNVSTVRDAQLNLNAAPLPVLLSLPGISAENARRILKLRATEPLRSYHDLANRLGNIAPDQLSSYVVFPSAYIALRIWDPEIASSERYYSVKLTPFEPAGRPWSIVESRGALSPHVNDEFQQPARVRPIPLPARDLFGQD